MIFHRNYDEGRCDPHSPADCTAELPHSDLNLLRVFDEVMAERSLTRAAHNLSLTQPAVSNARRLRERWATSWGNATGGQGMAPRQGR
jgi:hypothetical protein